ncbi:hypothetical protein GWL_22430 [Herbaspirillum sp. GW103]|nr:hypothetical protein GWL_22430 [Herbaspirillum sp. GW103]
MVEGRRQAHGAENVSFGAESVNAPDSETGRACVTLAWMVCLRKARLSGFPSFSFSFFFVMAAVRSVSCSSAGAAVCASDHAVPRLRVQDLGSAVVAPLSFSVQAGQCLAVEGASGVGKTRLLRLIADLDEGQGEAWLEGRSRSAMPAPQWRRQVLYQAAEAAWWDSSVMAHLQPQQREAACTLAMRLDLPASRLEADLTQLSTGERQRAALIRSLLQRPAVLMLDEPTSALDADNVARVEAVLREAMQQGMALLLVTHAQEQAQRLASGVLRVMKRERA